MVNLGPSWSIFVHFGHNSARIFYTPNIFSDEEKEGDWRNFYTDEKVDLSYGVDLDGGARENCGIMDARWQGWRDFMCSRDIPVTCACEHPGQMYLQLRGLCPLSSLDKYYVPRNRKKSGSVELIGLKTTVIEYHREVNSWVLSEFSKNTTGQTKASQHTYALGSHEWRLAGDHYECSEDGAPYTATLKLTGCTDGQFTCSDGQCIRDWIVVSF